MFKRLPQAIWFVSISLFAMAFSAQAFTASSPVIPHKAAVTGAKPGPQGVRGFPGKRGIAGKAGTTGQPGPAGADGSQGSTGTSGGIGARGSQGDTGLQGLRGAQGSTGATGAIGDAGLQGPTGDTGTAGTNGTNGSNGTNGVVTPLSATAPASIALPLASPPVVIVFLDVPAGNYVILAKTQLSHTGAGDSIDCSLKAGAATIDTIAMKTLPALAAVPVSLQAVATVASPTRLSVECRVVVATGAAAFSSLIAIPAS